MKQALALFATFLVILEGISVTKGNFEPSTDYEWHTKTWCWGNIDSLGNSDPQMG